MNFDKFRDAFHNELEKAARDADKLLGCPVPRDFEIELHGAGSAGVIVPAETAVKSLYLDEDHFYRIIDFGVIGVGQKITRIFVRASAHEPASFGQTWNTPPGRGPFKQIGPALNIRSLKD